jgi:hypothetical protein
MRLIKFKGDDGQWLAINADQIEHVRYRPATAPDDISQVEIMFAGNPERTLFIGPLAEQCWELLADGSSAV